MHPIRVPVTALYSVLSPEQRVMLGFPSEGEVEVRKRGSEWVLSLSSASNTSPASPLHAKVLRLIQTHQTHELIEGRFEQLLSAEELKAFEELKRSGSVVVYKSNPRFDKGIYRIPSKEKSSSSNSLGVHASMVERPMDEYTLVGDGFQVLRTEGAAKAASFDLAERIRGGEVKGIKSFDGFYYLIENELLQKHMSRILGFIASQKKADLSVLSSQLAIPLILARIVLEFAKEEGSIIEKQKNLFAYVG
jgi:hypothetical protein